MSRRNFFRVLLVAVAIFAISVLSGVLSAQGRSDAAFERVKEVQERHTARLMKIKDVVGTAIGLDGKNQPELKVLTARRGVAGIAKKLDGVAVQTVVTGKIYALKGPPEGKGPKKKVDPTARFDRPVPIGVSTGNEGECSSGTIGARVTDGANVYALSNNHVYALENQAPLGSRVLQPGRYDAKPKCAIKSKDVIGTLADFQEIVFSETANNTIDAAIAEIIIDEVDGEQIPRVGNATPLGGYGVPKSIIMAATLNQPVKKYGRTTGLTKGKIYMLNATVNVDYGTVGNPKIARFVNQIIITPGRFSDFGDSGSLVVLDGKGRSGKEHDRKPIGLLFAGGYLNGVVEVTVANPIDPVLARFVGVTIDGE